MSKMDGLRAMREARHAEATKRAAKAKPALTLVEPPVAPAAPAGPRPRTERPAAVPELPAPELCGHRAISGRTCTREQGHAAKSHRYS